METFSLSVEELAISFSFTGKPDFGKLSLVETFTDLSPSKAEERLTAATHSLIARGFLQIRNRTLTLKNSLSKALSLISTSDGCIISLIITKQSSNIRSINFHCSDDGFTAHWVQYGIVHHIIYDNDTRNLTETLISLLPSDIYYKEDNELNEYLYISASELINKMESISNSGSIDHGISPEYGTQKISAGLLRDIKNMTWRGVITFTRKEDLDIPLAISPSTDQEDTVMRRNIPVIIFFKGLRSWLLAFPANETPLGRLTLLTEENLKEHVSHLADFGYEAFM